MDFTDTERATLLRALFELWSRSQRSMTNPDRNLIPIVATIPREQIEGLVRKLGGDLDAAMVGAEV